MWFLALFTVVAAFGLLTLNVFPGILEQYPVQPALGYMMVVFATLAMLASLWRLLGPAPPPGSYRRMHALIVTVAILATSYLLTAHTPRRLVFAEIRDRFEEVMPQAPPAGEYAVVPVNLDLGLFWVDQWGTDARGGTYLRTCMTADAHGADRRSFGFAFAPNADGSPFGDHDYRLQPMDGGWYSFAASEAPPR